MIFANKQDLAGAKESGEIAALLGLASIKDRSWQIQGGNSIALEKGRRKGLNVHLQITYFFYWVEFHGKTRGKFSK